MITQEGFVESIVILVEVRDNNIRRLVFNHLHALTFIDILVLGLNELSLEIALLLLQTLHPSIESFNLVP